MILNADDKRLIFVPIEEASKPPTGFIQHIKDHWWCVHPSKGLIYFKASEKDILRPQANLSMDIAVQIQRKLYPWGFIKFIPSVFRRINPKDWVDV